MIQLITVLYHIFQSSINCKIFCFNLPLKLIFIVSYFRYNPISLKNVKDKNELGDFSVKNQMGITDFTLTVPWLLKTISKVQFSCAVLLFEKIEQ